MTEQASPPEIDQPQITNLTQVDVESVKAELVRMHQSAAQTIEADEVELHISGAFDVKAGAVSAHESGLGLVHAGEATLQNSGAGRVEMGNTYAGLVAGREIHGERIESLILLSRKVDGNVTTIMDTRGALIAGLVGGLFAGIMLLLGRVLFDRK